MATINRFEDLLAWKKGRELVREIYKTFKPLNDSGFKDQIQRASVSIISNIAEGFESGTRQEFLNYLYIAKGSAGEVRAQLYAAYDVGYINAESFKHLKFKAKEVSKLLSSFIKGVKGSPHAGLQRKRELSKEEREAAAFDLHIKRELARLNPEMYGKDGSVADYSNL